MKTFAVAYVSFFENDLKLKICEAETWKEAIILLMIEQGTVGNERETREWIDGLGDDLKTVKEEFFDADCLVEVIEL